MCAAVVFIESVAGLGDTRWYQYEEDKIINNKFLLGESYMKDEFSVESWMLHHCSVRDRTA